ncbi:M28 family peptidase [candidate division KSB1 bacterium]|nr:M28 family peptidase [candidate division KSB1 bacterium]
MKKRLAILLTVLLCLPVAAASLPFNADSAYATIEHLSVTIGPRPVGSSNEKEALRWAMSQFVRFDADSVFYIPLTPTIDSEYPINTESGIAVGIFKGKTDTSIVLGGHIDSSNPHNPGANDNASGVAVMLELARVWSDSPRHYTLVFVAFGGEEEGLLGSEFFVKQYAQIDSVALMFSLDMAGCDDTILILSDLKDKQTPKWLIRDALRIDREQEIHRLVYWPHFVTFNSIGPGAGSDHMSFLKEDIPAIDFSAGLNKSPIHSPQDDISLISKSMLGEYGKLIHYLLLHYQENGIPSSSTEQYMLMPVFGLLLFIPLWAMIVFCCTTIGFAGLTFIVHLKRRRSASQSKPVRFSGLKLIAAFNIILFTNQAGQFIIQLVKGVRHPWVVNVWPYIGFGVLLTIAGVWLAAQIMRRWRFSEDPSFYAIRLLLLVGAATILFILGGLRLAMYPALMLLLICLALWLRRGSLKIAFLFLAIIPPLLLVFNEAFIETARFVPYTQFMTDSSMKLYLIHSLLQLILLLPVLPLLFGTLYLYVTIPGFRYLLMRLRKPIIGIPILILIISVGWFLIQRSSYNEIWKPFLHVNATYDMQTQKNQIQLIGTEYLRGVRFKSDSLEKEISARTLRDTLPIPFTAEWISVSGKEILQPGKKDTVIVSWQMKSSQPWQEVSMSIRPDTSSIDTAWSDLNMSFNQDRIQIQWQTDPSEKIDVQVSLVIESGARLIREIKGRYGFVPVPLEVESDLMNVRYRTEVTLIDTMMIR